MRVFTSFILLIFFPFRAFKLILPLLLLFFYPCAMTLTSSILKFFSRLIIFFVKLFFYFIPNTVFWSITFFFFFILLLSTFIFSIIPFLIFHLWVSESVLLISLRVFLVFYHDLIAHLFLLIHLQCFSESEISFLGYF